MNWRAWLKERLDEDGALTSVIPANRIHGAGSLTGSPGKRPFALIHLGEELPVFNEGGVPEVTSNEAVIWIHDDPGSYDQIDEILVLVIAQLTGQVSEETGIACVWQGNSGELSDEAYGTITRNSSFRLVGRK